MQLHYFDVDISTNYIVNYVVKKYKEVSGTYTLLTPNVTGQFMNGYSEYMEGQNTVMQDVLLDEGTYFYNYDADIPTSQGNALAGSFDVEMEVGRNNTLHKFKHGSDTRLRCNFCWC